MSTKKTVFVTGGAGYIGSHCVCELLNAGYEVVAIDNFANCVDGGGVAPSLERVEEITGKTVKFYPCDLLDPKRLDEVFKQHKIDCVIHFAAMKAVGESMQQPLLYYRNNVMGTINLLEAMKNNGCYQLVFSSSCCVYGNPATLPITEEHPTGNVTNVYGRTKHFIEVMLKDLSIAEKQWNIIALRYFNPVGAHPSGRIGEDPTKAFTNLMPYIAQVALGKKPSLVIFGGDYDTVDGTGVRDYIHVMDLASGHVSALKKLFQEHQRFKVYNIGLGKGLSVLNLIKVFEETTGIPIPYVWGPRRVGDVDTLVCNSALAMQELDWRPKFDVVDMCKGVSVLELVKTFEKITGTTVPYEIRERREGDIVSMYANAGLAHKELGWNAQYSLEQMCKDFWHWQTLNPNGYRDDVEHKQVINGTMNGMHRETANGKCDGEVGH